jgi:hypothetical protein
MSVTMNPEIAAERAPEQPMGLLQRTLCIFAKPADAWTGLRERAQWWFPLLLVVVVTSATMLATYDRAIMPTIHDQFQKQLESEQITQAQMDRMETMFSGPTGKAIVIGQQIIFMPIALMIVALVVWFGGGFILGKSMGYRLALEVASWSSLVTLPAFLIQSAIAAVQNVGIRNVHVGLGALLPVLGLEPDAPTKLSTALGILLDALGPLQLWYVGVLVLGMSALTGAARKSTAWVVGGLYLAIMVLWAAVAWLFTPGS